MLAETPEMDLSKLHFKLETLFEDHRVAAFERVFGKPLETKSLASILMMKAHMTLSVGS